MRIGIVGEGRLGGSLVKLLRAADHQVYATGRTLELPPCDLRVLSVPDGAIRKVAEQLPKGVPTVHCSGATGLDVVAMHAEHGSFHPLMTFPGVERGIPNLAGVPCAIDGTTKTQAILRSLADTLGMDAIHVAGERALYHASAVIAGNFATLLLAHAAKAMEAAGIPDGGELLLPLAIASLTHATTDPGASITGPAARGDEEVISAHLDALRMAKLEGTAHLYEHLTAATRTLIAARKTSA